MSFLLSDIRFGARILARSPVITLWVILALALGIGANSAMFSAVDTLLLHPVDYTNPSQLVLLWERDAQGVRNWVAPANFADWRARARSFSELAAWSPVSFVMTGIDQPRQLGGAAVSENLFRALGVRPVLGRTFVPGEDGFGRPGSAARVAVISYQLWQERFGGGNVLGATLLLNAAPYTIVGVMPADFAFLARRQVWVPLSLDRLDRDYHSLFAVARLRVSRQSASAEMSALARTLAEEYPASNGGWSAEAQDLLDWMMNRTFRTRLLLLFGAVALVLFITCANVAGLLLSRSLARSREMAVRAALGASRARLIRQLLTENLLLAFAGGAAGLAVGWTLIHVAPSIIPANVVPAARPVQLNAAMIWFIAALSAASGIVFGLAPTLAGLRVDLQSALKDGGRGSSAGRDQHRLRQAMVAIQVAVALVLLASAALMTESLNRVAQVDPGFDMKNVLSLRVVSTAVNEDPARSLAFRRLALERFRALPGVESAAAGSDLPLSDATVIVPFDLEDSPPRSMAQRPGVSYTAVSPGYFETLRIPLRAGRTFADTDYATAPPVVIVNETFAERYFPAGSPVGKRILLNRPILGTNRFEDTIRTQIVGVAGSVRLGLATPDREPLVYVPDAQNFFTAANWFAVRSHGDLAGLASALRAELRQVDGDAAVDQVSPLDQTFARQFSGSKFQATIMSAFAVLALLLAAIGIYGINAYAVAQRRYEIGVRMALGATPFRVLGATIWSGMRLTLFGILAGLLGAVAGASLLRSVLVGVSATAPLTLAAVSLVLAAVSLIACYLPARRAMLIEPAAALRQE